MGFDTMQSFRRLMLNTNASSAQKKRSITSSPCHPSPAPTSPEEDRQQRFSAVRHKSSTMSATGPTSAQADTIPSFRAATSQWSPVTPSPPLSPRTPSPGGEPASPQFGKRVDSARGLCRAAADTPVLSPREINTMATELFEACCAGDLFNVAELLDRGAPLHASTLVAGLFETFKPAKAGHLSPLAGAATYGHIGIARLLLSRGAEINPATSHCASSPLHQACRYDDLDMARFLIANGADVNLDNSYLSTPLMYAIKYGSLDLISMILDQRPDLSKVSFIGAAAVHWAVWPGDVDITELLLRKGGADPNHAMADGCTPLHCAVIHQSAPIVECLLRYGADPLRRNEAYETPLMLAEKHSGSDSGQAILCMVNNAVHRSVE